MSDTTTITDEQTIEADDANGPKALREALKAEKAKTAKLTEQLMEGVWEKVGLDPKEGLGLAIAERYDGEPTVESLAAFAAKYGHEVPEAVTPADEINQAQSKLDQAAATAGSIPAPSPADDLAKAEAEGDYATAMAIKNQRLLDSL